LDLPPRAANALHFAAGFAPPRPSLAPDAPELSAVRDAARAIITVAAPAPALVVDRRWTLIEANAAAAALMAGAAALLSPPVNVLRLTLHPEGLAPMIVNYRDWRAHVAARLTRDAGISGDDELLTLRDELLSYPVPHHARPGGARPAPGAVALPLSLKTPLGTLNLFSATTMFGAASEVTASELMIESFWPATDSDRALLAALAAS
ncbi:MAG: hypothetical protein WD969_07365, partial [Paracoccaceae bacterium]